jgi:hypothetical protein
MDILQKTRHGKRTTKKGAMHCNGCQRYGEHIVLYKVKILFI